MSAFERPRATSRSTSSSRGVSSAERGGVRGRRRPARVALDQPARDRRGEERVAGGDHPDGLSELVGARVLEQEAARAGAEGFVDVVVEVEGGQDQDAGRSVAGGDPACRLDPVEVRHADVHQDDVGAQRLGGVERGEAVGGLADDLEVGLGVEDDAEAGADELLVVGDQDADHVASPNGSRARTA